MAPRVSRPGRVPWLSHGQAHKRCNSERARRHSCCRVVESHTVPDVAAHPSTSEDWSPLDWAAGYVDLDEQGDWIQLQVRGEVPPELCGTYMRNGPGRFGVGDHAVAHPFDGDGAVSCVCFQDGRLFYRSKLIQTLGLQADAAANAPQFRGIFGSNLPGGVRSNMLDVALKNTANTGVLSWGSRLFALMEAGQPHELDPATLATVGLSAFEGSLSLGLPFRLTSRALQRAAELVLTLLRKLRKRLQPAVKLGGDAMAAHYRVDPVTGRLVTLGYHISLNVPGLLQGKRSGMSTELTFREYTPDFALFSTRTHRLEGYAFVHDFAITQRSIVVLQNAVELSLLPLLEGRLCPIHCLSQVPGAPMHVHVLPRGDDASVQPAPADPESSLRSRSSPLDMRRGKASTGCEGPTRSRDCGEHAAWDAAHGVWDIVDCRGMSLRVPLAVGSGGARVFEGPQHFVHHIANAWETEGTSGAELSVQYVGYESMPDFAGWSGPHRRWQDTQPDEQPCSHLHTLSINMDTGVSTSRRVSPRVLEFPKIDARRTGLPSRYVYGAAALDPERNRPQQGIAVYDTQTGSVDLWTRGWRYYVETNSSEVVVLDASRVSDGPVAFAPLPGVLPHGLHGTWASGMIGNNPSF